jgi:peptidoglycan/LPS O-acetylase OafA/YrhL
VLTDRFVRNFENIFQAALHWNLKNLHTVSDRKVFKYTIAFLIITGVFTIISPWLIKELLNTKFTQPEYFYLQAYCAIVFLGPMMTTIGFKYYVYKQRQIEFSILVTFVGISGILVISMQHILVPLQIALPISYGVALAILMMRKYQRERIS